MSMLKPENSLRNNNLLKTESALISKYKLNRGPGFTISLPGGGALAPVSYVTACGGQKIG